ncbi:magnesium-translocating P-type ATPase [Candidatus Bathyarchaeota archaeon]|nr:magnesium-translocating P-type ATPase [Candidatus Bathyarchaeota archaeon]
MNGEWSPSDDVESTLGKLGTSLSGLSEEEADRRLREHGRNELGGRETRGRVQILVSQLKNSLVFLLIAASAVSYLLGEVTDAFIIASIVIVNSLLGFYQEYQSEKALERLGKLVTMTSAVRRGGRVQQVDSRELVPGDMVFLELGDVVPADLRLVSAEEFTVDESALTGESFPVRKSPEPIPQPSEDLHDLTNTAFMSTYVKGGKASGVVVATGRRSFIGRTARLLKEIQRRSEFQHRMEEFSGTLMKIVFVTIAAVIILKTLLGGSIVETILFSLALAVGMVPEALPVVVTISLSHGALTLARKKVVVKRLVSVEDLGNVDVLCTDKTGTITENMITLENYGDMEGGSEERIIEYAFLCTPLSDEERAGSPIDQAIRRHVGDRAPSIEHILYKQIPFNSTRKRNSVLVSRGGETLLIVKGAPEFIIDLSTKVYLNGETKPLTDREAAMQVYRDYGARGLRTIAVAYRRHGSHEYSQDDERGLTLLGFVAFIDPPKASAAEAFQKSRDLYIGVKILTGDGPYVTREIARQVGIHLEDANIVLGSELDGLTDEELEKRVDEVVVVCRATPEQKHRFIKALKKTGRITACLGDGVNDAPALKEAHVGIAVDQGTDIAKDAADIVLLEKDLMVIMDGIEEGRRTFSNIVKYIVYTIAGNFGDLYTIAAASLFMSFLPMLPSQLILSNFLTDTPVISVSTDNVEDEELVRPRRWDINRLFKFSGLLGAISAIFDAMLIVVLLRVLMIEDIHLFRTALFLEIVLSEILVLFMIRSDRFFLRAKPPSWQLVAASLFAISVTLALIYLPISPIFDFKPLTGGPLLAVVVITLLYVVATETVKIAYYKDMIKPRRALVVPLRLLSSVNGAFGPGLDERLEREE